MIDAGIAGEVSYGTAHLGNAAAGGEVAVPRQGRWRPSRGLVYLMVALVFVIGAIIAAGAFLVPLVSAAGGCGGG